MVRFGYQNKTGSWEENPGVLEFTDLKTGERLRRTLPLKWPLTDFVLSADGSTLLLLYKGGDITDPFDVHLSRDRGDTWRVLEGGKLRGLWGDKDQVIILGEENLSSRDEVDQKLWTRKAPRFLSFSQVQSGGAEHLAFCSDEGLVFLSEDGGKNLQLVQKIGVFGIRTLSLSRDGNTYLVAGASKQVHLTRDFGRSWTSLEFSPAEYGASALSYNGSTLLLLQNPEGSADQRLLVSEDRGEVWEVRTLPPGVAVRQILILKENHWLVLGVGIGLVHLTQDGGRSWKVLDLPEGFWFQAAFLPPGNLAICGSIRNENGDEQGVLWFSEDGGYNFRDILTSEGEGFVTVALSTKGQVAVAGKRRYFYIRSLDQKGWKLQSTEHPYQNPKDVSFSDSGESIYLLDSEAFRVIKEDQEGEHKLLVTTKQIRSDSLVFSDDGQTLATLGGSYICLSRDRGETWFLETRFDLRDRELQGLALSGDGHRLFVFNSEGLYRLDYPMDNSPALSIYKPETDIFQWCSWAVDGRGDGILAAVKLGTQSPYSFLVIHSTDGGSTWQELFRFQPPTTVNWVWVSLSRDGEKAAVSVPHHERQMDTDFEALYITDNGGRDWSIYPSS